jgi:hypothetical protein
MDDSNPLDLLSVKMCSPLMVYLVFVVFSCISLYITRTNLKKFNTQKMENLYSLYSLHEIKFIIVMGVMLYGLCQYNQVNLAWIFLIFPIIYMILRNTLVFNAVSMAQQNAPRDVTGGPKMYEQASHAVAQQQAINQAQQQQQIQSQVQQHVNKNISGLSGNGMSPPLNGGGMGTPISGISDGGLSPF